MVKKVRLLQYFVTYGKSESELKNIRYVSYSTVIQNSWPTSALHFTWRIATDPKNHTTPNGYFRKSTNLMLVSLISGGSSTEDQALLLWDKVHPWLGVICPGKFQTTFSTIDLSDELYFREYNSWLYCKVIPGVNFKFQIKEKLWKVSQHLDASTKNLKNMKKVRA